MWCCRWPKCNRIYRLFFEKTSSMPCLFCRNSKFSQIFCQLHFYIRSLIYLGKVGLYVLSKMPTDVISDIVNIASWTTPPNPWAGWTLSIGDLPYTLASQVKSVPILMNQLLSLLPATGDPSWDHVFLHQLPDYSPNVGHGRLGGPDCLGRHEFGFVMFLGNLHL